MKAKSKLKKTLQVSCLSLTLWSVAINAQFINLVGTQSNSCNISQLTIDPSANISVICDNTKYLQSITSQVPVCLLEALPSTAKVGSQVVLVSSCIKAPTSYSWRVTPAAKLTEGYSTSSVRFSTPGLYTVGFRATNASGTSGYYSVHIKVVE